MDRLPPTYKNVEVDQVAGDRTPGMSTLRPVMNLLDFVGRVDKHSLVKPKRRVDVQFRRWFAQQGSDVNDIPEFRNAKFTGVESYKAFAKYAHPEPVLDSVQQSAFQTAISWMCRQFGPYMSGSSLLTTEDVVLVRTVVAVQVFPGMLTLVRVLSFMIVLILMFWRSTGILVEALKVLFVSGTPS